MKIPDQRQWCRPGVFIINFEQILHFVLVFLLLTWNKGSRSTMFSIASGRDSNVIEREGDYKLLYVTLAFTF